MIATMRKTAAAMALVLFAPGPAAPAVLVIDRGGTYRGHWSSDDPDTPAVTIRTAEPVVIEDSELSGPSHLVATAAPHAKITIRRCVGRGRTPGVAGRCPGRFLNAEYFDRVSVERNELVGTSGIYLLNYRGDRAPGMTVRVVGNRARNIDGRKSDGRGGTLDFNKRTRKGGGPAESGFKIVQFLQLDKVRGVPGMEVAWNEVVNEPGLSRVEDNINIYLSGGTAASPLRIHDNFIRGAYTIRPWQSDASDRDWSYDWGYSGGGILLGDGRPASADEAPGFVVAEDNQVLDTSNYGIAVAAGHDIAFARNRIVSAGRLADGRAIASQNVGAYIWDMHRAGPSKGFARVAGRDNRIGWVKGDGRNDWWTPDADASAWTGNVHWPGAISPETLDAERALWLRKLAAAKVTIGPTGR